MYGLLCENLRNMIIEKHGEAVWLQVRDIAGIKSQSFVLHNIYSDSTVSCLAQAYSKVTSQPLDSVMYELGVLFVSFVEANGYNQLLKVLGRNMRDFLNGLDSLHEYLRFSYTKLKPPSFFVEMETARGMILHYRSKRIGYLHYVAGQIEEVGRKFYNLKVETEVLDYKLDENGCHVIMNLIFDNKGYVQQLQSEENSLCGLFLNIDMFFDIFPFYVMYDRNLEMTGVGNGLRNAMANQTLLGKKLTDVFRVIRPTFEFTWKNVIHTNVIFELTVEQKSDGDAKEDSQESSKQANRNSQIISGLHLKGHMMFIQVLEMMLFLASPVLDSLETMYNMGVFVNDLALHDSSRDLVLQTVHQSVELKHALDGERSKSTLLEDSVQCLEMERKKADSLLYRMIPKQIAGRLRNGESALDTCETFENVTILFSDVVGFTRICTKISPMDVVTLLNSMYIKFDQLSVRYCVYKVETIGDGYMLAGGIPTRTRKHADNVADMALKMLKVIKSIPNPDSSEPGKHLEIRTGIHSGMVVAGVVGVKMPRYCLFGDTVNIASKLESNGSPNACHISETTLKALTPGKYFTVPRGSIDAKQGVYIKTHWLMGLASDRDVSSNPNGTLSIESSSSRSQQDPSPVHNAACQLILSRPCPAGSPKDSDLMGSPSNMLSQFTFQEMERFIRENELDIFSDGNVTPDNLDTLPGPHLESLEGSCSESSDILSTDSFNSGLNPDQIPTEGRSNEISSGASSQKGTHSDGENEALNLKKNKNRTKKKSRVRDNQENGHQKCLIL